MKDNRVVMYAFQDGLIKIIPSSHVPNRLKLLEEETGKPLTLLGVQAGGDDQCAYVRGLFKQLHKGNDWYRNNTELIEYIEQNAQIDKNKPLNWQELKEKLGCSSLSDRGKECLKLLEAAENLPPRDETEKLLSIEEAASMLGISQQTLRKWEEKGKIEPQRTEKGHRRYTKSQIMEVKKQQMKDLEFLLPNVTPNDLIDMMQKLMGPFDPMEKINVTISRDTLLGKVKLIVDTVNGLNSVTKSFDIKE